MLTATGAGTNVSARRRRSHKEDFKESPFFRCSHGRCRGKSPKEMQCPSNRLAPVAIKTRFVDLDTGVTSTIIADVPFRAAAPATSGDATTSGPLLVPWSPKEKESDEDSNVKVVSSVTFDPFDRSSQDSEWQAPCDEGQTSSASSGSSASSSEGTSQSASPSAMGAEENDSAPEAEEEDEPESSNYRVMPEGPE
jgi:hypothetical protein